MKNNIENIIQIIHSIPWFSNIGNEDDILINTYSIKVFNLEEAIKYWKSNIFIEAKAIAWEAMRQVIIKKEKPFQEWEKNFDTIINNVIQSLKNSSIAKEIMVQTGEDIDDFSRKLPFLTAYGEMLIADTHPDYKFNTKQLSYFLKGHWVCGWIGELYEDVFRYPETNFIIY